MPIAYILALLGTGIGVGFASGLLGVGGCFIMIPVQYWVYTAMGVSKGCTDGRRERICESLSISLRCSCKLDHAKHPQANNRLDKHKITGIEC